MSNPRVRGLVFLGGFLAFAAFFCGFIPFTVMPSGGTAVALPVITVPGEVVVEEFLPGFNLTNTIIATVVVDLILVAAVVLLWRASKGWTREVPGRLQGFFEMFIGGFYNFCANIAGDRLRTAPFLWPLVATIFLFLLTANYVKLLPGVETFGYLHCAHAGFNGYPMIPGDTSNSYRLWVDETFDAGIPQTVEMEEECYTYFKEKAFEKFSAESAEVISGRSAAFAALMIALPTDADLEAQFDGDEDALEAAKEARDADYELALESLRERDAERYALVEGSDYKYAYSYVRFSEHRVEDAEAAEVALVQIEALEHEIERLQGGAAEGDHSEEAAVAAEADHSEEAVDHSADNEAVIADLEAQISALETTYNLHNTRVHYPGAAFAFTPEELETSVVPYAFHITPFLRGPATDLSLTFMLAIVSIVMVQVYGVIALGPAYFEKFINLTAIGKVGKRPLGLIDFVVGLIEIISEIGKIVSLSFRLFGNLFAGGVTLIAITFLMALMVPGLIYGLELIIGGVQALVFAVLTLVFSVQAMESHHGDDEHPHEEAAH